MASGRFWNDELCPQCGKQVEILNGDVQFSMDLHSQAHKPLETINYEIDMQEKNSWPQSIQSKLNDLPPHCKENAIICNSDESLTIALQTVIQKTASLDIKSEEKSSPCSNVREKMEKLKAMTNPPPLSINLLNNFFSSMPLELKSHQGFISENENGKLFCNVCKVTIQSITSINKHLKTRLHEDRTIKFFTDTLPDDLHYVMEFVSFNNSRLCCNLCRVNFYFYPDNPNDTTFCIMKHYLSKEHIEKKTRDESYCNCAEAPVVLKSLSRLNPIINNNQQYLEFKMQPEFICKLCNVVVGSNLNETSLNKSLNAHFISETHLSYMSMPQKSKDTQNIVESNVEELRWHMKQPHKEFSGTFLAAESKLGASLPASSKNNSSATNHVKAPVNLSNLSEKSLGDNIIQSILKALPQKLQNTKCIVQNSQGKIMCLICTCEIPASVHNVKTHLLGGNHKIRSSKRGEIIEKIKSDSENIFKMNEYFEQLLEKPLKEELTFIKFYPNKKSHCLICNLTIPTHINCLQEHLKGHYHKESKIIYRACNRVKSDGKNI